MKEQKPPENQLLPNTGSAGKSQDKQCKCSSSESGNHSQRRDADKAPPCQHAIILHFILFEKSLIIFL